MRTHKQIEASRRNGALSLGPTTPAGKARSAANSLDHRLTAETVVLTNESRERYQALLATLVDFFQPASDPELFHVEEMAMARWRLRRSVGYETALLDYQLASAQPFDEASHEQIDHTTRGALAWNALHETSSGFHNLTRYETTHRRAHQRAFRDFLVLRNTRIQNEPNTPQTQEEVHLP